MPSPNLIRKLSGEKTPIWLLKLLGNIWLPYLGAGIAVDEVSPDYLYIKVSMKLHWYNKNYVGTHFGGSLYAMTDPFYMLMLMNNLGRSYIVWDKAASIDFKKPGKGKVTAEFKMTAEEIADIKAKTDTAGKYIFDKPVNILNESGEIVATVIKTLYVRKKT